MLYRGSKGDVFGRRANQAAFLGSLMQVPTPQARALASQPSALISVDFPPNSLGVYLFKGDRLKLASCGRSESHMMVCGTTDQLGVHRLTGLFGMISSRN